MSVGRRRWKCHLRLGWPRLRLMALSGIRRQVSWGRRFGIGGAEWRGGRYFVEQERACLVSGRTGVAASLSRPV